MDRAVNTRRYRSEVRAAQAENTRRAILQAARELFTSEGYNATVAQVAQRAGVAVDTVYASVGRKPALVLAVIDMVLGGTDQPIPARERTYVQQIESATSAQEKITVYAHALATLLPLLAPLQDALREAGRTDPDCAQAWSGLVDRRAHNMLLFAEDLRRTGQLRADLDDQQVADIIWATNSAEYFLLLAQRGWTPDRHGGHLIDMWTRTLLDHAAARDTTTS
ncbi:MAG: helix-turn-helix domain-containing protein [Candidatus Nanopelagicales bacterium]